MYVSKWSVTNWVRLYPSSILRGLTFSNTFLLTFPQDDGGLEFVFPYGATLNAQKPAVPILSSGSGSRTCGLGHGVAA
jgi:hypothetical protein